MRKLFISIVALATTLGCGHDPEFQIENLSTPQYPQIRYVYPLAGLKLRKAPDGKVIKVMPMNAPVTILACDESNPVVIDNEPGFWCEAQLGEHRGWLFDGDTKPFSRPYYLLVVAPGDLALKAEPSRRAAAVATLPVNHIGRIESTSSRTNVAGKKGHWLMTTYKDQKGWVFSGDVMMSEHEEELWKHLLLRFYPEDLPEIEFDHEVQAKIASKVTEYTIQGYTIYQYEYTVDDEDDCDGPLSQVVFRRHTDDKDFGRKFYSEFIVDANQSIKDGVVTYVRECYCCCLSGEEPLIYFPRQQRVTFFHYPMPRENGYCLENGLYSLIRSNTEIRSFEHERGTSYFIHEAQPDCSKVPGFEDHPRREVFALLEPFGDSIGLDQYSDEGIPKKFKDYWAQSVPLHHEWRAPLLNEAEEVPE